MATRKYPWGTASPANRIRETSTRARNGLAAAHEGGIAQTVTVISRAARASQPLAETLDHLSRAGLRTRGDQDSVAGSAVAEAVVELHKALGGLGQATPLTLSDRFRDYLARVETVLALADDALARGISPSGAAPNTDPWGPFVT